MTHFPNPPGPLSRPAGLGTIIGVIAAAAALVLTAAIGISWWGFAQHAGDPPAAAPVAAEPDRPDSALERIRERGSVRIGIIERRPYAYIEGGEAAGLFPELVRAVFADPALDAAGVPEVEVETFLSDSALLSALQDGGIDVIASGMEYQRERCRLTAPSDPAVWLPDAFLVEAGNPQGVENYDDIIDEGLTLGTHLSGSQRQLAEAAGIPEDQLVPVSFGEERFDLLDDGEIDAFAADAMWLRWTMQERGDDYEVTEPFHPAADGDGAWRYSGLLFAQEDADLRGEVNAVLADIRADGRLLEIGEPFGFTEDNEAPQDTILAGACPT